ncbi:MAG: VCBS repeat-containing protein [Pyrinomonadaceae bacterium]
MLAQSSAPVFDAPWRGFDTGIFPDSGFAPASFAVGDLDGDGDSDVLVGDSHFYLAGVTVLKNNGDKTFARFVYYPLEPNQMVGEVALSDFDGDGDLDAFASVRGSFDQLTIIRVWRNNGDGTLASPVSFPTGTGPADIVAADFTGDGKPDIATANAGANSVSLLKHNGQAGASAGFLAPVNFPVSATNLNQISAGDANGDGKLDLAVSGFDGKGVLLTVLMNDGNGNFAAPTGYQSAPGSRSFSYAVALRDLNNDGKAELMGGGLYSGGSSDYGALTVRRFGANNAFGAAEIYQFELGVPPPKEITTGDINGDGSPDIIAAVPSGRTLDGFETLLSNGTGGFQTPGYYEASQQTFDVAAFDADGDGDSDVATLANSSAAVTIHENPGNGVFRVPVRYDVAAFPDAVESADIDNDGDIDILTNNEVNIASNDAIVKILKNNGNGTFAPAVNYTTPRNFGDMKLRDINGDGYVDMVFAPDGNYPSYHLGTALNNGNGTFAPTVVRELFACGGGTVDASDLDGDGDRDIVFVEEESCQNIAARIFVLRNDGNQNFAVMPVLNPPGLPHGLAIADVTGDGKADVITAVSGKMEVFPGSGNLTFGAVILSTSEPYKFTTADFNGDGKLDLGMIMQIDSFGTDSIATALGNGNGTFQTIRTQTGSSVLEALRNASDLDAADFNGDGKKDLLTYNYASNDVSLFLNAGDGSLLPHRRYGIGSTPILGTAADFNGDGKIDIAATIGLPPLGLMSAVVVLKNTTRTPPRTKFDFDGDGKTDISIFRPSNGEWWYLKSSNGGNYAAQFGASNDKLVPADFTGDGKTDIAIWRPSTGEWFILRSEDGSYYSFPFGTSGDVPAVGDFDADGKADAAVFRPSNLTWYINKSTGGTLIQQFGISGDVPVVADYDGDSKTDIAIYRPSNGQWWIQRSSLGTIAYTFGNSSDMPVQGDYTGDGKTDAAIYRPSTGEWFILRSEYSSYYSFPFGTSGDVPAPGDYDGDGRFDATVFRPSQSTWYAQRSTAGTLIQSFGIGGDKPVPNAFVP